MENGFDKFKVYKKVSKIIKNKYENDPNFKKALEEQEIEGFCWEITLTFCNNYRSRSSLNKYIFRQCDKLLDSFNNINKLEIPLNDKYAYSDEYLVDYSNKLLLRKLLIKILENNHFNPLQRDIIKEMFFNDSPEQVADLLCVPKQKVNIVCKKFLKENMYKNDLKILEDFYLEQ